jgi:hypothetical protein
MQLKFGTTPTSVAASANNGLDFFTGVNSIFDGSFMYDNAQLLVEDLGAPSFEQSENFVITAIRLIRIYLEASLVSPKRRYTRAWKLKKQSRRPHRSPKECVV